MTRISHYGSGAVPGTIASLCSTGLSTIVVDISEVFFLKKFLVLTIVGFLCLLMFAAGCTTSSGTPPAAAAAPATTAATTPSALPAATPVTETTWSGTWDTTFDGDSSHNVMILVQTNETVTGTYSYHDGRISGTVQGTHLIGKWFEFDGVESDRDSGPIDWVLSSDAKSFEGTWAYGDDGPDAMTESPGKWTGTRTL